MVCDILTEIISTLFKMYTRLLDKIDYLKFQIEKEKRDAAKSKVNSAAKAAVQIEMSANSDDISEHIEALSANQVELQRIEWLTREFENVEMLQNLQLLLGVKFHNILLRIVFELMNSLLETKPTICQHFVNTFTVDILLKIFEDYHDTDLKISAIDTITQLSKESPG